MSDVDLSENIGSDTMNQLNTMPALAGSGGYFAMDIPHNTTWEIK